MRYLSIAAAAGVVVLAACGDSGPSGTSQVGFALATKAAAPSVTSSLMAAQIFSDPSGDSLVVDSVFVVVRKLKLEGGPANSACAQSGEMDHDSLGGVAPDSGLASSDTAESESADDDCNELKLGPFLIALPLDSSGALQQFSVTVDTGTYSRVKFQIHKPEGANDAAFLAAHPEYAGVSIRVAGRWNGTPFIFTTGVTDVQEVRFNPPLVVGDAPTSFTLFVDLSGWFRAVDGSLIDPATAGDGGANATVVHQNIVRSFHAFEDGDHDGHDDHEGT